MISNSPEMWVPHSGHPTHEIQLVDPEDGFVCTASAEHHPTDPAAVMLVRHAGQEWDGLALCHSCFTESLLP